jgi:hypothetical protein
LGSLSGTFKAHLENFDKESSDMAKRRLKATMERGERYANQFTEEIINIFQNNVFKLGQKLHIDNHSVMVFSESFVRFHLVFQFSKCLDYI